VDATKRSVLPALVRPANLYHLKPHPAQTKALLAGVLEQRTALTDPTKDVGKVVAFNVFSKVKLFQNTPSSNVSTLSKYFCAFWFSLTPMYTWDRSPFICTCCDIT